METTMAIRMITSEHLDAVVRLEQSSFDFPMGRLKLMDWLLKRGSFCLVYEVRGQVVAYMLYAMHGHKPTYLLHSIAVDSAYRFQGIASEMLSHLKLGMIDHSWSIFVSVRSYNIPAVLLLTKNGFVHVPSPATHGSEQLWTRMIYSLG